jgi:hypothetical protein
MLETGAATRDEAHMPKPGRSWKLGLGAFALGVSFAICNIWLGEGSLANLCFALAVLCDAVVVVCAILWVYGKTWHAVPPQQMQGMRPMQGMPAQGMPMQGMQIQGMPGMRPMQPPQPPGVVAGGAPDAKTQPPTR